ncbi:uncharacterized protein LOC115671811 isoform X3 [Syzygium oleosum]|uniref:uncharacterized protein LOC115671811 isoform X3 n=1 Tax=Syzygium oleosum TaxID=219896 RepID=UPI0024B90685|nr:uncharacterized protein LOC115671811 isoform X3 [Syzygium oleosum]
MSALFNFHSFLTVVLLVICTCTYVKMHFPAILEQRTGFRGFFWKAARIVCTWFASVKVWMMREKKGWIRMKSGSWGP